VAYGQYGCVTDHEQMMGTANEILWAAAFMSAIALALLSARADQCDVAAAKLTEAIQGVTAARQNDSGGAADAVNLTTSAASEASVDCPTETGFPIDLFVAWDGAFPPGSFYDFAGRAGHIVAGAAEKDIRDGAKLCQQTALRGLNGETVQFIHGSAYFECQAFGRDDGGTAISIYARRDAPRGAEVK
jgi:hypothetical protein